MDILKDYNVPKPDIEKVQAAIYEFYRAKAVFDGLLTYERRTDEKSKNLDVIPLDLEKAEKSGISVKDLQYLRLYPESIKNIVKPVTSSKGLSDVIITSINNDVLARSFNERRNTGKLNGYALSDAFDFLDRLMGGQGLYDEPEPIVVSAFDVETIMSLGKNKQAMPSHIYDYAFVNYSLDEKNQLVKKSMNGLIGIKPESMQAKELEEVAEKLESGSVLNEAEKVNFEFISRVGASAGNIQKNLNAGGEIVYSISELNETPGYKNIDNYQKGLEELLKIGRQQEESALILKSGKKLNLGEKQFLDALMEQTSGNSLLFGHNIQDFDIPAIVRQIESSEEMKEYAEEIGFDVSRFKNARNVVDTHTINSSLNQHQKSKFYASINPLRKNGKESLGQAEVLYRSLFGSKGVHHNALTDVNQEFDIFFSDAKYADALKYALGAKDYGELISSLVPSGERFLEEDFFDKAQNGLIMRMDYSGGTRSLKSKDNVFGFRSFGNTLSFSDGTILNVNPLAGNSVIERDSIMGKGMYQAGSFVRISGLKKASEEEAEAVSKIKGIEKQDLYKVGLMPMASKTRNDYSVVYMTEEEARDFFTKNTVVAKQEGEDISFTEIGNEILEDTYYTLPDGKAVPLKSLDENPLKALEMFSEANEKRTISERSIRRLETGSLASVIRGDEIGRAVYNINNKVDQKLIGKLHNQIIDVASNKNLKMRDKLLAELQKTIDKLASKTDLTAGSEFAKAFGEKLDMTSAEGWLNAFSIGNVLNLGWVNNTMFFAQNMEPDSKLAFLARKTAGAKGGSKELTNQLVFNIAAQTVSSDSSSLNIPSRNYSYTDNIFLPLNRFGRRYRKNLSDNINKKYGITLDLSNRSRVEKNYQEVLKIAGMTGEETLSAQRQAVFNFIQDITWRNPLFLSDDKEMREWLNDKRKWLRNNTFEANDDPLVIFHKVQEQIAEVVKYRRENGDHSFGINPFPNNVNMLSGLFKSASDEDKKKIDEEIGRMLDPVYKSLYEYMDHSPETNFYRKDSVKNAYKKEAKHRLVLHEKQRRAVRNYAYKVKQLVEDNGGKIVSTRDGKIFAQFAGEDMIRIDTMLPKLFQNGPASYLRLGGSNYLADFDARLKGNAGNPENGYFEISARLESIGNMYFNSGKDKEPLAQRMLDESDDKGATLAHILGRVAGDLREAGLQSNNPVYDADLSTGLNLEEFLTNGYKRESLKEYLDELAKDKNIKNFDNETQRNIKKLKKWLEDSKEGAFVGQEIKNVYSALIVQGALPNNAKAVIKTDDENGIVLSSTSKINRFGKFSRENRGGFYSTAVATSTPTDLFSEIGRNIGRVEINAVRFSKSDLLKRGKDPNFSIAKKIAENSSIIVHQRTFAALSEADRKSTSALYAKSLNATSADVDELAKDIEKYLVEEKGLSEDMAREMADKFHMRTNVYEGGGSISGRWITATGAGEERKYKKVVSKNLAYDERWNKAGFIFQKDERGYITGFEYNRGYIVRPGKNAIHEFSDYLESEAENKVSKISLVRRKLIDNNGMVIAQEDVLDFLKKSLKKENITEEDISRAIANGDLREVAEISAIERSAIGKFLGGYSEKHMLVTNIDTLKTAARIAEDIASNINPSDSGEIRSSLGALVASQGFKRARFFLKREAGMDLLESDNFELLEDLVSGRLNHEIWDLLGEEKEEIRQKIIDVLEENEKIYSKSALEELQNMFLLSDAVEAVTGGAHVVSSEIEQASKHKTETLIKDTWLRLLNEKNADEAFEEYKGVFSEGMVSHSGNTLIFNFEEGDSGYYDTKKIREIRRKYGWGDTVSGDYIDENGKLANDLVGGNDKYFVYDSLISQIEDAKNFDKDPKLGARELHALANNIIYTDNLGEVRTNMAKIGLEPLFEDLFGDIDETHLIWQEKGKRSGMTGLDLLLQNVATWNYNDTLYKPKDDSFYERELKAVYESLPFKNVPVGRKWLEDIYQTIGGSEAYQFEKTMIDTKADHDEILEKVGKAFFWQNPDNFKDNIVKVEDVNLNFQNALNYARYNQKAGEADKGMIWGRNSIVELFSENDERMRELLGENNRYVAVPMAKPEEVVRGSSEAAFPEYQKAARRLFQSVNEFKENPTDELKEKVVQARDRYIEELGNAFRNKKSIYIADKISPRVQFGARMKGQVRDYASVINGRQVGELGEWTIEGQKFKDLIESKNLPSFTIASVHDLDKFGYDAKYFKKQAKLFGYKNVGKFKEKWLEEARTHGVDAIVNRSPSDYQNSTVATKVFFTDSFGSGVLVTDSITAAKMKLDSDGDHFYAAMLSVRSALRGAEGAVLDTTTFNMLTSGGEDEEKIKELEKIYGEEAVKQIMDLRDVHRRAYMADTFSVNSGWLANASSWEKYQQFVSQDYEAIRQKKILEAQEKYFEQYGVDGKMFPIQRSPLSKEATEKALKDWNEGWFSVQALTSGIVRNQSNNDISRAAEEIMSSVARNKDMFSFYNEGNAQDLESFADALRAHGSGYEKRVFSNIVLSNETLKQENIRDVLYGTSYDDTRATIEQGIKSKDKLIQVAAQFALANHQQGVGEIDPALFLVDVAKNAYTIKNKDGLTELERASIDYARETLKEGFLSTKKGYSTILEKTSLAQKIKDEYNTMFQNIANGQGAAQQKRTLERIRDLMLEYGFDATERFPQYSDKFKSHEDFVNTYMTALPKVLGALDKNLLKNTATATGNYLAPELDKITAAVYDMAGASTTFNRARIAALTQRGVLSGWQEQAEKYAEATFNDFVEENRISRSRLANAASRIVDNGRRKFSAAKVLQNARMPKFDKWAKVGLGIVGAGFIGGNPSEPSGYESNKYARKPSPAVPQPQYRDQMMMAPEYSRSQQGYSVTINARSRKNTITNSINDRISQAIAQTYPRNGMVMINTNMNYRQDEISNSDLADYLANAL